MATVMFGDDAQRALPQESKPITFDDKRCPECREKSVKAIGGYDSPVYTCRNGHRWQYA